MRADSIAAKIKTHWELKVGLGFLVTVWFAATYALLQRFPMFPVKAMKVTFLDNAIPFVPGAVYIYESLWLLMPIAPWLMDSRAELLCYLKGLFLISLIGFTIFALYPTSSPRPITPSDTNALYEKLVSMDKELNAFPSLHAALAVFNGAFCVFILGRQSRSTAAGWFIWVWVVCIVLSTLLTKQHVVLDVVAGSCLGAGGFAAALFLNKAGRAEEK